MSSTTPNLNLTKYDVTDNISPSGYNDNFDILDGIIGRMYPVGAIYLSIGSTDPGLLFGGTWSDISDSLTFRLSFDKNLAINASGSAATNGSNVTVWTAADGTVTSERFQPYIRNYNSPLNTCLPVHAWIRTA